MRPSGFSTHQARPDVQNRANSAFLVYTYVLARFFSFYLGGDVLSGYGRLSVKQVCVLRIVGSTPTTPTN